MPIFEQRTTQEVARDLKRLLRLAAGITRSEVPTPEQLAAQSRQLRQRSAMLQRRTGKLRQRSEALRQIRAQETKRRERIEQLSRELEQKSQTVDQQSKELKQRSRKLKRAWSRIAEQKEQLGWSHRLLDKKDRWIEQLVERLVVNGSDTETGGVDPEKLIWIFGTTRTGSTWLASMMADLEDHAMWDEPMVGRLFGQFYSSARPEQNLGQLGDPNFIMGDATRPGWLGSIRYFVLNGIRHIHPRLDHRHHLVIKEPNGSLGAPLLLEALPESRMILLVRDPRDVVASRLNAIKKGNWLYNLEGRVRQGEPSLADTDPDSLVKQRAKIYSLQIGKAKEAYDSHEGPKALVRYEDLRSDAFGTMRRLYSDLEIAVDEDGLARSVEAHSWENVPEEEKGEGKFHRKAKPGGWREDLTAEQVKMVEEITAPLLEEFYTGHEASVR